MRNKKKSTRENMLLIKTVEEYNGVKEGDALAVIDFTASWCAPCKMLVPVLNELSKQYPDVVFAKVDVDEAAEVASEQSITSVPTIQIYQRGRLLQVIKGAQRDILKAAVAKHAAQTINVY